MNGTKSIHVPVAQKLEHFPTNIGYCNSSATPDSGGSRGTYSIFRISDTFHED